MVVPHHTLNTVREQHSTPAGMAEEEDIVVPKGWVVKYSQSKEPGRPYYVRLSDGHRQWDPPSEHNWELIAAVVILAAVGLYPSTGDPGDSSAVLTHNGCICAPYSYDGDRQIGAGCIPDGGGDSIGWCDVEPGCAAAKDVTQDNDGWDMCTPTAFSGHEYQDTGGAEYEVITEAVPMYGAPASFETNVDEAGNWSEEDHADADQDSEDVGVHRHTVHADESLALLDRRGTESPRPCSDEDPCPSGHECELDEELDLSVCVYVGTQKQEDENLLSFFQAKAGTPAQIHRQDTTMADAVRAKVKEDPEAARAGAAVGRPAEAEDGAGHPNTRRAEHAQAAGGRGASQNGHPKGRPQSREQMKARAEAAARAREAAAAAQREREAAEREAEIAAENAAQAKFERQMTTIATAARWFGAMFAMLIIFECSPSLHNGFYRLCIWLLCGARGLICFGSWLAALLQSRCGSASLIRTEAEAQTAPREFDNSGSPVLSVVVVPAPGESVPWRVICRRLMEQTSEHDRTELLFVSTRNLGAWAGHMSHRMPRWRLQPRFITYEPKDTSQHGNEIDELEAFRAGAAHAQGGFILFVPSDVILPARYDQQVREALLAEPKSGFHTFAGAFRFGIYPRALAVRIQQEEQAIDRLEQRLTMATAGATTAQSAENTYLYDAHTCDERPADSPVALRTAPAVRLFSSSATKTAALESELLARRQQFTKIVR